MTTPFQRALAARKLIIAFLIGLTCASIARAQTPPVRAYALPPKIASTSKAMKKSVAITPQKKIVLSWNQYTNVYFRVEGTTNLCDWYFVTNIFPKWPTNCTLPINRQTEFFRIQTTNQ